MCKAFWHEVTQSNSQGILFSLFGSGSVIPNYISFVTINCFLPFGSLNSTKACLFSGFILTFFTSSPPDLGLSNLYNMLSSLAVAGKSATRIVVQTGTRFIVKVFFSNGLAWESWRSFLKSRNGNWYLWTQQNLRHAQQSYIACFISRTQLAH